MSPNMFTFCAQTAKYLSQLQEEKISLKKVKNIFKIKYSFLNLYIKLSKN